MTLQKFSVQIDRLEAQVEVLKEQIAELGRLLPKDGKALTGAVDGTTEAAIEDYIRRWRAEHGADPDA